MVERKNKKEKSKTKNEKGEENRGEKLNEKKRANDDDNKVIASDHNLGSWEGEVE